MPRKDKAAYSYYMGDYMRRKYNQRRAYVVKTLGGKCTICASAENLNATPGEGADASFNLAKKLNNADWNKIKYELQFYYLLCGSCLARRSKGVEHGGGTSGIRNCTCGPCKTAKAKYMLAKREQYNAARKAKRAKLRQEEEV